MSEQEILDIKVLIGSHQPDLVRELEQFFFELVVQLNLRHHHWERTHPAYGAS